MSAKPIVYVTESELQGEADYHVTGVRHRAVYAFDVMCWCQRLMVPVPQHEIMDGLTRSCGKQECLLIDEDIRWKSGRPGDNYHHLNFETRYVATETSGYETEGTGYEPGVRQGATPREVLRFDN